MFSSVETYDNLHGYKKARGRFSLFPVKNTFVLHLYAGMLPFKPFLLFLYQALADLDNVVLCTVVDLWIVRLQEVQDIHR